MIKKTITYENYNGESITEDFYFNLSRAEILEMEVVHPGGLSGYIEQIINTKDNTKLMELFKFILCKAYGVKSADGKRFIKSKELSEEFTQTEAYSELFIMLATDADAAVAFVNGIVPKNIQ